MRYTFYLAAAITLVGLVGVLITERRPPSIIRTLLKGLSSSGFVLAAFAAGAAGSTFGRFVLCGLLLSLVGDLLLTSRRERFLMAGLAVFLAAQLVYIAAFAVVGMRPADLILPAVVLVAAAFVVGRYLSPHLSGNFRSPVFAYIAVISFMLMSAVGVTLRTGVLAPAIGAGAFYLSDLAVARDRFVKRSFRNRLWGLPLYCGGQLLLAASTALLTGSQ